jgi:SAM-dependent methyltransferase
MRVLPICYAVSRLERADLPMKQDISPNEDARERARRFAAEFIAKHDDPNWHAKLCSSSASDSDLASWSNLTPDPLLIDWLTVHLSPPVCVRALVVGCGLGDDAEELADWGFKVTAFDISTAAIEWCRDRFVGSAVTYVVGDLLHPPAEFLGSFDFILEDSTLQTMGRAAVGVAVKNLSDLLSPGGMLLIITRGRRDSEPIPQTAPLPLMRADLDPIERVPGMRLIQFEDFMDHEDPPVRRFRAVYRKD